MRLPRLPFSSLLLLVACCVFRAQCQGAQSGVEARLRSDIAALTKFPSRVPGTPGNAAAADYVKARFTALKLTDVRAEETFVTAPVSKGAATLSLGGRQLPVFPLYPNQVVPSTTPKAGISGPMIYVGQGLASDFNGKKIDGAIVALDFNSGMNWITAADLGARAIVFLQPKSMGRIEAEHKFTMLPVEVPRYYATGPVADAIKAASITTAPATLKSLVVWEHVPVRNVLGFLKGTNPPAKDKPNTIIVNAYYDSMSVVPDLAPGAEAAGNCAALFELIARLQAKPPTYNVLFVANGAHHLALAGVRSFLAQHVIDADGKADDTKKAEMASYRAFVNLDLTSRTQTVGLFAKSWFYNQMTVGSESILLNQFSGLAKSLGRYADEQAEKTKVPTERFFVDGVTGKEGRTWRSYMPSLIALDSEAATEAALPGISFATANDARLLQDTPFDTPDQLNYANLAAQVETVDQLLNQTMLDVADGDDKASPVLPPASNLSKNFGFMVGRAIYRNVEKATSFLPDTPLPDSQIGVPDTQAVGVLVTDRTAGGGPLEYKSYDGVRGLMIERGTFSRGKPGVNPVSQFIFTGPRVGDTKGGGTPNYEFEAYSLNRDGHLIFAPDRGSERQRFSPIFTKPTATLSFKDPDTKQYNPDVSLICFSSRAATIFDTLDQRYFSVLREMTVLNAQTDASPVEYSFLRPATGPNSADIEPIAIVFSKPGERFKLIMAAGLLGKRLVILNTNGSSKTNDSTNYEGMGFKVLGGPDANRITKISYQAALDLWTLDQQRIRLLKGFGINNERVDALHGAAGCPPGAKAGAFDCPKVSIADPTGGSLQAAQVALGKLDYDAFYRESRRAFGLESRAYPDVEATSQDVLKGIIFYLALLLPFAYFVERMLFGFPDVRKQIVGTSVVFLGVFGAIRFVHPAFELATTPFIILLAFVILALTVVVTAFLQSKFEQEIKRMKQGIHYADLGRLSALGASLGLGIANMRRRPTRTALTCITLILLTFTVLSFTSVTANIANFARPYGDGRVPAYQGFLVRQPDWSAMQEPAVTSLVNEIAARKLGQPALRSWLLSRDQSEALYLRVTNATQPNMGYYAPGVLGLTPEEKEIGSPISGPQSLIKGRWFEPQDTNVCLLPRDVLLSDAERKADAPPPEEGAAPTPIPATGTETPAETGPILGLTLDNAIGSEVQVAGKTLKVIGVFDDRQWFNAQDANKNLRDIDNEEFSPVDYSSDQTKQNATANSNAAQQGNEVQVQRYEHMRANALLVVPYKTALAMGGTTRSVAVGIKNSVFAQDELDDLMQRAALGIFGSTPDRSQGGKLVSKLYSSVEATSYEGFASLAVPILIAALIIANTMLGSVYERTREIGIYSSIGLAPVHIAALFIAEAIVYAVLGSISGYLIAQIVAKIITATNVLPGITLNYSSSSAVIATLIVMLTVLLSTVYPAWAASKISNPDSRKAEMGEPVGDLWRLQFPFTVSGLQSLGMAQFLADYFESHTDTSVGKFYTDRVGFDGLSLRDAVEVLNEGVPKIPLNADGTPKISVNGTSNGTANGVPKVKKTPLKKMPKTTDTAPGTPIAPPLTTPPKGGYLELEQIAASPDTEVYRLSMRTWLAPFDMGVSQDTDIILLPSDEPGLYELQLRLARKSGEIAAWKRVNREFMTELRKQLLVWRTIKQEAQQEYILRGRAHINHQQVPSEEPDAVVV